VTYRNHVLTMGAQKGEEFIRYKLFEEDVRALRQAIDSVAALAADDKSQAIRTII
jgi:hypothetical protein